MIPAFVSFAASDELGCFKQHALQDIDLLHGCLPGATLLPLLDDFAASKVGANLLRNWLPRPSAKMSQTSNSSIRPVNPMDVRQQQTRLHVPAGLASPHLSDDDDHVGFDEIAPSPKIMLAVILFKTEGRKRTKVNTILVDIEESQSLSSFKSSIFQDIKARGYSVDKATAIKLKVQRTIFRAGVVLQDEKTLEQFWTAVKEFKTPKAEAEVDVQDDDDVVKVVKTSSLGSARKKVKVEDTEGQGEMTLLRQYFDDLMVKHACQDTGCDNCGNRCYFYHGRHVPLQFEHIQRWAASLVRGTGCSLDRPPNDKAFDEILHPKTSPPSSVASASTGAASDQLTTLLTSTNAMMATAVTQMASGMSSRPAAQAIAPAHDSSVPRSSVHTMVNQPISAFLAAHPQLPEGVGEALDQHAIRRTRVLKMVMDDPDKRKRLDLALGDEVEVLAALDDVARDS